MILEYGCYEYECESQSKSYYYLSKIIFVEYFRVFRNIFLLWIISSEEKQERENLGFEDRARSSSEEKMVENVKTSNT